MKRLIVLIGVLAVLALPAYGQREKDTAVEPTSWGQATGQVYDAVTAAPITGAAVDTMNDGRFTDEGKPVAATNADGVYMARAIIGRVSSNVDVGRLLTTGLVGLAMGAATNQTKRIDITRLCIHVHKDGYNDFEGIVVCRSVDPALFAVKMQPILLTPAGSSEVSTAADGWGVVRVSGVSIQPAVLHPGHAATVTVTISSPPVLKARDLQVSCGKIALILSTDATAPTQGTVCVRSSQRIRTSIYKTTTAVRP